MSRALNRVRLLLDEAQSRVIDRALQQPGEIQFSPPFLACCGPVEKHTDEFFPQWSAFLVLRNDGCRVWQRKGYKGTPKPGQRFMLNIHKLHGVEAKEGAVLALVCADGDTQRKALKHLAAELRNYG